MSTISVNDKKRADFLEALGLTSSSLSTPDLERQVLLDITGIAAPGVGLSNADLRAQANYSQSQTFTGFESDVPKLISGLAAYYRADKIAGVEIVRDRFDRANGPLGTTETGQVWTAHSGTWSITNNSAAKTAGALASQYATVDVNAIDFDASITYLTLPATEYAGLAFRYVDDNNNYFVQLSGGTYVLTRRLNGVQVNLATSGIVAAAGDIIRVTAFDSDLKVFRNGNLLLSATDTTLRSGTRVGLTHYGTTYVQRFDDFSVKTLAVNDGASVGIWPDLSGNNRHAVQNTFFPKNLLTQNQATVETDTAGLSSANANGTLARSTAQFAEGTASAEITTSAVGPVQVGLTIPAGSLALVTSGLSYVGMMALKSSTSRNAFAVIDWYTAGGAYISSSVGAALASSITDFTNYTVTGVAPGTATQAVVRMAVDGTSALETHYFDKLGLFQSATVPTWRAPNDPSGFLARPLLRTSSRNLLTYDAATFETGIGGWAVTSGCTLSRSTVFSSHGSGSLLVTSTTSNGTVDTSSRDTGNSFTPIKSGTQYTAMFKARGNVTRLVKCSLAWFTSTNVFISSSVSSTVALTTDRWSTYSVTANAPSNAVFAVVVFRVEAGAGATTTDLYYIDEVGLFEGTVTEWVPPVAIPNNRPVVQFDGKDDLLQSTAGFYANQTIFVVGKAIGTDKTLIGSSTADQYILYDRLSNWRLFQTGTVGIGPASTDDPTVLVGVSNGATSLISVNGATTAMSVGATAPIGQLVVGVNGTDPLNASARPLVGELYLIAIYDRVLSDADRKRVEKWLGSRFGIAVAA